MSHSMTTPGNPSWIAYVGPNPVEARQFYGKVMGWNIVDLPMPDGTAHAAVMVGDQPVGGFSDETQDSAAWEVYITVVDVDKSYSTAVELGAKAVSEPTDVPGVGRIAKIIDPQGAFICLVTYESMQSKG